MKRLQMYKSHGRCLGACCHRLETEPVVREGLAYSPADMAKLTERGMPVNSLNNSQVHFDGEDNPSWFIGSERERFVDVADLWEQDQLIRDKARRAKRASVKSKSK